MSWEKEIEELRRREALAEKMGGAEKVARQHERRQEFADRRQKYKSRARGFQRQDRGGEEAREDNV